MNPIAAQQVALDNALVAPENRVQIGKCNMRINPIKTQKEPVYQVVLDALALTTFYPAFLIKSEKLASPSKKKALVVVEEHVEKPVKKLAARRQSDGVQIRDTPGVFVSKKKAPTKTKRSKGIELLSEAMILKEAQMKKAIKRSKRETTI
nr:hypothetical protein [Tanacetum cinerariifolium]